MPARTSPLRSSLGASEADRAGGTPFLKWAGGKWTIAPLLLSLFPADARSRMYREPFLGGGAIFFYLAPKRAALSDTLADLIITYEVVRTRVESLIDRLQELEKGHSEKQFYAIRERFNTERNAPALERAAWLVYLNKTCFNGLFRTNQSGGFNVPIGRYKAPRIVDPARLRLAARALEGVSLKRAPFRDLLEVAEPGDFIYLDPPYVPLSRTANFAAYADASFGEADQADLASVFRELDRRGCLLALSNSDTELVYEGYSLTPITAPRAISSKGSMRQPVGELVVRNLKRYPKTKTRK
jgi:DNA adenine methylase